MVPWFPLFGRDFLAGTLGWSAEERGHYVVLLIAQWEQDGLPDDLARLELISPGVRACWSTLATKFPVSRGGRRRNRRLEHERHKACERSERARQSASARWAAAGRAGGQEGEEIPVESDCGCHGTCDGTCHRICPADASTTTAYSPPPPPPPPAEPVEGWEELRTAWNGQWKTTDRQWRSTDPPPEAVAALGRPGWLAEALRAMPEIKKGACKGFDTPPTLRQFCAVDKAGVPFTTRMLGGEFTDRSVQRKRRERTA